MELIKCEQRSGKTKPIYARTHALTQRLSSHIKMCLGILMTQEAVIHNELTAARLTSPSRYLIARLVTEAVELTHSNWSYAAIIYFLQSEEDFLMQMSCLDTSTSCYLL